MRWLKREGRAGKAPTLWIGATRYERKYVKYVCYDVCCICCCCDDDDDSGNGPLGRERAAESLGVVVLLWSPRGVMWCGVVLWARENRGQAEQRSEGRELGGWEVLFVLFSSSLSFLPPLPFPSQRRIGRALALALPLASNATCLRSSSARGIASRPP